MAFHHPSKGSSPMHRKVQRVKPPHVDQDRLFCVTIREMRPEGPGAPIVTNEGVWRPPASWRTNTLRDRGRNGLYGPHNRSIYVFERGRKFLRQAVPGESFEGFQHYRTTSLYHHGGLIYTTNSSAVNEVFATAGSPWQLLHFQHHSNGQSRVVYGAREPRLQTLPQDFRWMLAMFPHGCRPPDRRMIPYHARDAAVKGEISTMLGLLALTAAPEDDHVHNVLLRSVNHNNATDSWHVDFVHGHPGWLDPRGLVVQVWTQHRQEVAAYEDRPLLKSSR